MAVKAAALVVLAVVAKVDAVAADKAVLAAKVEVDPVVLAVPAKAVLAEKVEDLVVPAAGAKAEGCSKSRRS